MVTLHSSGGSAVPTNHLDRHGWAHFGHTYENPYYIITSMNCRGTRFVRQKAHYYKSYFEVKYNHRESTQKKISIFSRVSQWGNTCNGSMQEYAMDTI